MMDAPNSLFLLSSLGVFMAAKLAKFSERDKRSEIKVPSFNLVGHFFIVLVSKMVALDISLSINLSSVQRNSDFNYEATFSKRISMSVKFNLS